MRHELQPVLETTSAPIDPADLLTPEQLAEKLQVKASWVYEQTRQRSKIRNKTPLPCIRLGKYLRFSWPRVCEWLTRNNI